MKLAALAGAAALVAVGVASATPQRHLPGIPQQFHAYKTWFKVNAKPIRGGSPAHGGVKNVYASKRAVRGKYPNGTLVVKEALAPGGYVSLIATMRKQNGLDPAHGNWKYIEWTRGSRTARFQELARDGTCWGCHSLAKKTDWVYTTR